MKLKDCLENYTQDELIALGNNDDLFNSALERLAAVAGLKIPGPEPKKPEISLPENDITLYEASGLFFLEMEEALSFLDVVRSLKSRVALDYVYCENLRIESHRPLHDYEETRGIQSRNVINPEVLTQFKDRAKELDAEVTEWKARYDEWKSRVSQLSSLRADLFERIADARRRSDAESTCQGRFNRYLNVAEGDVDQAWKFFVGAGEEVPEGFDPRDVHAVMSECSGKGEVE